MNPALWVGVTALAVPLAIHLLTRRTPKHMTFPTLRFLRAARAHQSRLYHLRHLLLLLTRMALLLLILLAFLRPVLMRGARRKETSEAGRTMLILMDVSASMGYVQAGVSPLAEARAAVLEILDHHEAGDRINLILMKVAPDRIRVKVLFKGAPAEKLLKAEDVILGANGKRFEPYNWKKGGFKYNISYAGHFYMRTDFWNQNKKPVTFILITFFNAQFFMPL